jgi:hypothetical protein
LPIDISVDKEEVASSGTWTTNEATVINVGISTTARFSSADLPSKMLEDPTWVAQVDHCLNSSGWIDKQRISSELKNQAEKLLTLLLPRLTAHVTRRIQDPKKHDHWCFQWAAKNFGRVAAIMVLYGHMEEDLKCLDLSETLLGPPGNFLLPVDEDGEQEGAYLYFDTNNSRWIRSGKVTGRSFMTRHKEHQKASKLTTSQHLDSRFYTRYHSKAVELTTKGAREGYFKNLLQYVACGIDRTAEGMMGKLIDDATNDGGLLRFDDSVKKKVDSVE